MKVIQELLRLGVLIEVDVMERMAVPRQKLLDPKRARAVHRAVDDDVPEVASDQLRTPEDERAHQDLAQLGVGLHERKQLLARELDHFGRRAHTQARHRSAARDHVRFARELSGVVSDDERLAAVDRRQHLHFPADDDEERYEFLAGLDEHGSARDIPSRSMCRHSRDLRRRQRGEQAFVLRRLTQRGKRIGRGHGGSSRIPRSYVIRAFALLSRT